MVGLHLPSFFNYFGLLPVSAALQSIFLNMRLKEIPLLRWECIFFSLLDFRKHIFNLHLFHDYYSCKISLFFFMFLYLMQSPCNRSLVGLERTPNIDLVDNV